MKTNADADRLDEARRIIDDTWRELSRSPYLQRNLGQPLMWMPEISPEESQRRSTVGVDLLDRLQRLDDADLPHEMRLTLRLAHYYASTWSREAEWYWLVQDSLGIGFFGLFSETGYCGGFLINTLSEMVQRARFENADERSHYLALMTEFARLLEQMRLRSCGQRERGILMPKVQVKQVRSLLAALRDGAGAMWRSAPQAWEPRLDADFLDEIDRRIDNAIVPAYEALLRVYDDAYLAQAPEQVGMAQYPGGAAVYDELVKLHTTLDLSAQQVHAIGLKRMADIDAQMAALRKEQGFKGDSAAYLAHIDADPRWRADTPEKVQALFQKYIDRFTPHYPQCFGWNLVSPHTVAPLPAALEGSMSFGYYSAPASRGEDGIYVFNGRNLTARGLANLAALTYHELVPGHHQHLVTQSENDALHLLQAYSFLNAYNEGWAEYAATLAGELGCYEEPEERYGRLMMNAFLTSRLVVDTGMNALGWSLEQARDYMRARSHIAESEVLTESIRYSCDTPGQALAYKLGDTFMVELRERMREALGDKFDLRDFHHAVLHPGALPLPVLGFHLDHVTATQVMKDGSRQR